jgi:hypothetical protein
MIKVLIELDCVYYFHPYLHNRSWNTEDEAIEAVVQVENLELFGVRRTGGQEDVRLVHRYIDKDDPVNQNLAQLPPANHEIWWVDPRLNR